MRIDLRKQPEGLELQLPYQVTNQGKYGPLRGAMPGMKLGRGWGLRVGLRWFGWMAAGWKVHAGAGVPSVVTGSLWTVRGR
jgi:hypothetical protein